MNDEAAAAHLKKARSKLRAARVLLRADEAEDCISRAYYAVFNAAQAALLLIGEAPRTHSGTHSRFWVCFVEEEYFPRPVGETFSEAQRMRQRADYDAFTRFDTNAASDLLGDAEAFVDAAEALTRRISAGEINAGSE